MMMMMILLSYQILKYLYFFRVWSRSNYSFVIIFQTYFLSYIFPSYLPLPYLLRFVLEFPYLSISSVLLRIPSLSIFPPSLGSRTQTFSFTCNYQPLNCLENIFASGTQRKPLVSSNKIYKKGGIQIRYKFPIKNKRKTHILISMWSGF